MPITPLPTPPTRTDPTTFASRGDAFLGALPVFVTEVNDLTTTVNALEVAAGVSAAQSEASKDLSIAAANAASAAAGAAKWVSGTTYADGAVTWSPLDYQTYRRKGAGGGTTDPSLDPTNWARVTTYSPGSAIFMNQTFGGF